MNSRRGLPLPRTVTSGAVPNLLRENVECELRERDCSVDGNKLVGMTEMKSSPMLSAIGVAQFNRCDLGDCVPFIGRLQ